MGAEYQNESAPGNIGAPGFYTVGTEVAPYSYYKTITIDRSMIPGGCPGTTLSNYPMLFRVTDPDLAHTTSGGQVTDLQGDDIIFKAHDDATCGGVGLAPCILDHEIEKYVSSTGELVAWVRIPSVNAATAASDTVLYVYYGNPTVTSPTENPNGVWDANYGGVWHLKEGTGVTAVDSTSNGNSAVPNSGNPTSATGQIGGALTFFSTSRLRIADNPNNSLELTDATHPDWTMSAWVKPTSYATQWPTIYAYGSYRASMGLSGQAELPVGRIENWTNDLNPLHSNSALALNAWHYVTITRTAGTTSFYVNGSFDVSLANTNSTLTNQVSGIGADGNGAMDATEQFLGLIDEVRVSTTVRSSCLIAAEYNNEVWPDKAVTPSPSPFPNPSTGFYTLGAATAVELLSFTAAGLDGGAELSWETGSEIDNLGFNLYRSSSASGPWERITGSLIPGLGSSPEGARYRYVDAGLENGVTYYYELEDVETTGRTKRHGPVWAVPAAGVTGDGDSGDEESSGSGSGSGSGNGSVITYGEPGANALRVVKRVRNQVVLELTTEGFLAYPEEDGSVRIEIPDWVRDEESGLPVEQTWVEALAGRQVELVSVRAKQTEAVGLRPSGASEEVVVASPDGVVRLRRGKGHGPRAGASREAARLVQVAFQGEVKKALVEMAPLSWDDSRQELRLTKKLYVTLSFAKREPNEVASAGGRRGRRERGNAKRGKSASGSVVARLSTRAPGLYAVSYEELFGTRAGARRGVSADNLRVSRLGETVAYHLEPSTSRFAPGSTLYFVSPGAEANPYGEEAVFEVEYPVSGGAGERMPVVDASASGRSTGFYLRRDEHEENHIYQAALLEAEDPWLWDVVMAPGTKEYGFEVSELSEGSEPGSPGAVAPRGERLSGISGPPRVGEGERDGGGGAKLGRKAPAEAGRGARSGSASRRCQHSGARERGRYRSGVLDGVRGPLRGHLSASGEGGGGRAGGDVDASGNGGSDGRVLGRVAGGYDGGWTAGVARRFFMERERDAIPCGGRTPVPGGGRRAAGPSRSAEGVGSAVEERVERCGLRGDWPARVTRRGETASRPASARGPDAGRGAGGGDLRGVRFRGEPSGGDPGFSYLRVPSLEVAVGALRAFAGRRDVRLQERARHGGGEPGAAADGRDELSVDGVRPDLRGGERGGSVAGRGDRSSPGGECRRGAGDGGEDTRL